MSESPTFNPSESLEDILEKAVHKLKELEEICSNAGVSAIATTESKQSAEASHQNILLLLADAKIKSDEVDKIRKDTEKEQEIIATKSNHIQNAQDHADAVRNSLDTTQTAATVSANEIEASRAKAQTSITLVEELLTMARTSKAQIDTDTSLIEKSREDADVSARALSTLAIRAKEADEKVAAYEKRLAELESQCKMQLTAITDLLPGATSAGLAHAFDARRQTFLSPAERWQRWFIGSLIVLALLALSELISVFWGSTSSTIEELGKAWLARLPFAAALVWLALHSAREAALAKRLEEDYGYKSAIAASFQGFNEQMAKISETTTADSPLSKLCADTLATLASPPGRIYDKHKLTLTPADKLQEIVEKVIARKSKEGQQ